MDSPRESERTSQRSHSEIVVTGATPTIMLVRRTFVRTVFESHCTTPQECVEVTALRTGLSPDRVKDILWHEPL